MIGLELIDSRVLPDHFLCVARQRMLKVLLCYGIDPCFSQIFCFLFMDIRTQSSSIGPGLLPIIILLFSFCVMKLILCQPPGLFRSWLYSLTGKGFPITFCLRIFHWRCLSPSTCQACASLFSASHEMSDNTVLPWRKSFFCRNLGDSQV